MSIRSPVRPGPMADPRTITAATAALIDPILRNGIFILVPIPNLGRLDRVFSIDTLDGMGENQTGLTMALMPPRFFNQLRVPMHF